MPMCFLVMPTFPPQVRLGVSIHYNALKKNHDNKVGLQLTMGYHPRRQISNSPCLLHESVFQQ